MIAQIQITEIKDYQDALYKIKKNKKAIVTFANTFCDSMVKRGGGVEDVRIRRLDQEMIVVELLVNVCEIMGANIINTIAEGTSPFIHEILQQGRIAIRILSNLCTERLTMSEFSIPIKHMGWKNAAG
jgi:degradative hydroxymethylglutaryl-CoA reductase